LPYKSPELRHALCKDERLDLKNLVGLASLDHERAKEPWQLPFSFPCDEQWEGLLLPQNRMMVAIQFPELLLSISLSFHEPSEEYILEIRMELKKGTKSARIGRLTCLSKLPIEPEPTQ
jgi:hypothetical protein